MNGLSSIALKLIAAIALMFVAYMVGEGSLGSRVTILETNYIHIKETMDKIYEIVLEDD